MPCLSGDAAIAADGPFLTEEESFVLQLIDGRWDVRSLVWIAPLRKIETVRALTRLVERGVVEIAEPGSAGELDDAIPPIDASAVVDTIDERFD